MRVETELNRSAGSYSAGRRDERASRLVAGQETEGHPLTFNRTPLVFGGAIEQPGTDEIKATPGLWNCSLDDAIRYGGDLTRAALGAMNLRGDRRHIVVDTKVHMLMPGFCPAIPGWHTDGAPRADDGCPVGPLPPNVWAQDDLSPPRYHLLVTGSGCLTQFVAGEVDLEIPSEPTTNLYAGVTRQVAALLSDGWPGLEVIEAPSCTVIEWDWWQLHQGKVATAHEWRFLIRATETDYLAPQDDLRKIYRTQQQVYVPTEFGW